jgi:hypothetical protein
MAKIASPPLYIKRKLYFWSHPHIATKFPLLGSSQGGGKAAPHQHQVQGRRGKGTTRKVDMVDEVEVAPWLLLHHG